MTCLGSGSAGNCYLLHNETECLVIEAGVSFKEVKKTLNFDISKIVGLIVSHGHQDHAKYVNEYMDAGIPVLTPYKGRKGYNESDMRIGRAYYGDFEIRYFPVIHDTPCFGFLIKHPCIGSLMFVTDTMYIKYYVTGLNHIMIECNYRKDLLDNHNDKKLEYRRMSTHMEFNTCLEAIKKNNKHGYLKSVCLLHLSDLASNAKDFKKEVSSLVSCPVYVADKGMEYEF